VALPAARLTDAPSTTGTAFSARSTRPTQDAQVMPSTARLTTSIRGSYPAAWTAATMLSIPASASARTRARPVARLTLASRTPGTPTTARSIRATQEAQDIPSTPMSMVRASPPLSMSCCCPSGMAAS